jgi:hypothetical protein
MRKHQKSTTPNGLMAITEKLRRVDPPADRHPGRREACRSALHRMVDRQLEKPTGLIDSDDELRGQVTWASQLDEERRYLETVDRLERAGHQVMGRPETIVEYLSAHLDEDNAMPFEAIHLLTHLKAMKPERISSAPVLAASVMAVGGQGPRNFLFSNQSFRGQAGSNR